MQSKERHREYNLQYYYNKRKKMIQQLGGKCAMCGSTENLEFDHIDSTEKSFSIGTRIQNSIDNLQSELNKCQLLCHNCHVKKSKEHKDTNVKIDKDTAIAICNDYFSTNTTHRDLSIRYGLSQWEIGRIVRGERWSDETSTTNKSQHISKHLNCLEQSCSVDMIDPATGKIVKTYRSMTEATHDGHASSHISDCCNGKKKTHHGFIWRKHV